MELSVIVSTLNGRERLLRSLDALDAHLPSATEVVVVNGPSSDGTTGAVRDRDDVDVLVEISERTPNVSRNAGIEAATGDVVALLGDAYTVEPTWYDALEAAVEGGAAVVTGPTAGAGRAADEPDSREGRTVGGRTVVPFDGDNVAFDRPVLETLDGFDEYLPVGGAVDCAHRLAALDVDVTWNGSMAVRSDVGADGGRARGGRGPGDVSRSLAYRLGKNYGPRPTIVGRILGSAVGNGLGSLRAVVGGEGTPSEWLADGAAVARNVAGGLRDGLRARYADRTDRRNPNGLSTRHDRAVRVYDRR